YEPNKPMPMLPAYSTAGTEDPLPTDPLPVLVRVPAIGQVLNPNTGLPIPGIVSGEYDGMPWTIQAGVSLIVVDTGDRQEMAMVANAAYDAFTNAAILELVQPPPMPGLPSPGPITKLHSRGAVMRLANPDPSQPPSTPGNPGPQPGFNYKSARYAPVIKYVEQLK
ncbi:MAG TPA: hypothetical protein VKD71_15230, partial [Gemmataceae bacterium]|nr:hypothetical protein [Gemmataceae bacterium]